jgi:hypothetical protein
VELAGVVQPAYHRHLAVEALQDGQLRLGHSGAFRGSGASLNVLPEQNDGHFPSFNTQHYLASGCQMVPESQWPFSEWFFC